MNRIKKYRELRRELRRAKGIEASEAVTVKLNKLVLELTPAQVEQLELEYSCKQL